MAEELTYDQVLIIKTLLAKGTNSQVIINAFDIAETTLNNIKEDKAWQEVPWPKNWKTITNSAFKLTAAQVLEIRELLQESKMTQIEIAEKYGVSQAQISYINKGRSWKTEE